MGTRRMNLNAELFLQLFWDLTRFERDQLTNTQALGLILEELAVLRNENKMLKEQLEKK